MSKCNHPECDLNTYKASDKCILHCKKEARKGTSADSLQEGFEFYIALKNYIIKQSYENFICKKGHISAVINHPQGVGYRDGPGPLSFQAFETLLEDRVVKLDGSVKNVNFTSILFPQEDSQSNNDYSVLLKKCSSITFNYCQFYTSKFYENMKAHFADCKFHNEFFLSTFKKYGSDNSLFTSCVFNENVKSSSDMKQFALTDSYFDEYCSFKKGLCLNGLTIESNIFVVTHQPSDFESKPEIIFEGDFRFIDCKFEGDQEIFLNDASKANIEFKNCDIKQKLKVRGLEYRKGYEYQQNHKSSLKSLKINSCKIANDENSYLRIGFLRNCEFELKNLKNQASSELNIGDCHLKSFKLTNFRNLGKFKLFKINVLKRENNKEIVTNTRFSIDNTSIGKADFQSINLTSFDEVFFFDNIFAELDYTNVQWKPDIEVGQYNDDETKKLAKKRDTYRTLKNVAIRNRDHPQALIFHAKEMENHYELTKWKMELFNKLTLAFNKYSNMFGMSWWRPVWLLLAIAMLFYLQLLKSTGGICIYDDFFSHYWVFLNPTHKVEFVAKGCWNAWTYFWDISFRISEGLLAYQIIQAFRKFSRNL